MIQTCTRDIHFCAGHRVMGHENKCANLHGHNYKAELTAMCNQLDKVGRIIDFSVLKDRIGGWIEHQWDHGFILHRDDRAGWAALEAFNTYDVTKGIAMNREPQIQHRLQKSFELPYNPTAENMARYLLEVSNAELLNGTGVRLVRVVLHETVNCRAEYSL